MKKAADWDEDYLFNLPVGEFDWLEVKGRKSLDLTMGTVKENAIKQTLSKALSAFSNSGGGILVYGLENPSEKWRVDDGGIELSIKSPSTREWLEDIIPNLVDTELMDFNVYVLTKNDKTSQIKEGRGVFIIEIGDSEHAPHQAYDNKYYARVAGKSRPLRHRLVLDILGRRKNPKFSLEFKIKITKRETLKAGYMALGGNRRLTDPKLIIRAENIGKIFANYVVCIFYISTKLLTETDQIIYKDEFEVIDGEDYFSIHEENTRRDFIKLNEYGPARYDPILPGLGHTWNVEITEDFDIEKFKDSKILWEIYADNSPTERGHIKIGEMEIIEKRE